MKTPSAAKSTGRNSLHVRLLEEAVRVHGHLELAGNIHTPCHVVTAADRTTRSPAHCQVLAEDGVVDGDPQDGSALLDSYFHAGLVGRFPTDELDVVVGRFEVVILAEAVGPHVPKRM